MSAYPDYEEVLRSYSANRTAQPDEYLDPADGLLHCKVCGEPRQVIIDRAYGPVTVSIACSCDPVPTAGTDPQRIRGLRENGLREQTLWKYTFANDSGYNAEVMEQARAYTRNFDQMKAMGAGLLLWGDIGTGKTYIAACIANALIDRGVKVNMTNFVRILNSLTKQFSEDRNRYLDELNSCSLLVLDDFGMERNTEFALEHLFNVIDMRSRSKRPMILTTNLTLQEMRNPSDVAHARIYDRILGCCYPLKVNEQNLRQKAGEKLRREMRAMLGTGEGAKV